MDEENAAQRGYTASMAESDFEQSSLTLGVDLLSCPGAATGARQDSTIPVTGEGEGKGGRSGELQGERCFELLQGTDLFQAGQ